MIRLANEHRCRHQHESLRLRCNTGTSRDKRAGPRANYTTATEIWQFSSVTSHPRIHSLMDRVCKEFWEEPIVYLSLIRN
jgi:hypothetical protein